MASQLLSAHIRTQARLRGLTVGTVERIWRNLPGYDRKDVPAWLAAVVPLVEAAQRQSIALTDAYIARELRRQPLGVDPDKLIRDGRDGTPTADVYERPFVTLWTALGAGANYTDALSSGLNRALATAEMDVQMAMRAASTAVQAEGGAPYGFQRVADGDACEFCSAIDGAYVKFADAMALHNFCGCGLIPLSAPHRLAAKLPSGVAVRQHGELGPVLGSPDHDFTSQADI